MTNQQDNIEWQLADIVDAIAAEIDRAEDTLSLKSYARGKSIGIKQLQLDLEVNVRHTSEGEIKFRTVEPGKNSATVLKLDFAQILENQLQSVRKDLTQPISTQPLTTLLNITASEIKRLNRIAIYSVDDLERYTQTAAMLAEVSKKTDIEEIKLRQWRKLPFLSQVQPAKGEPGGEVVIEGSNLGEQQPNDVVLFQGKPAEILSWTNSQLRVRTPDVVGSGPLFAIIEGQTTNLLNWESVEPPKPTVDLAVRDIRVLFTKGKEVYPAADSINLGKKVSLTADLINLGNVASEPFAVQWLISAPHIKTRPIVMEHGSLEPNQTASENSIRYDTRLTPGEYNISFTVDPNNKYPDINRENNTFTKKIVVKDKQPIYNKEPSDRDEQPVEGFE
ncbi:hypothetical protein D5R40_19670 [Okeania hirsuta]|uniref:CARDB domain-containing protein n=1 Tax=Okeania hirsuta TaxID=1458930 RepID=A0A3N6P8W4_9CYAN|nr:IPT/TIG domain-containing protein [Okeania hirsuta]RQH35899.1 hypothetical protein D5R40_19670 [Okeania hirsuta]